MALVVAPAYAFAGINAILAAWILLNFLGSIFHERSRKAGADLDRRGAL